MLLIRLTYEKKERKLEKEILYNKPVTGRLTERKRKKKKEKKRKRERKEREKDREKEKRTRMNGKRKKTVIEKVICTLS